MVEKGCMLVEISNEIHIAIRCFLLSGTGAKDIHLSGVVLHGNPMDLRFQLL